MRKLSLFLWCASTLLCTQLSAQNDTVSTDQDAKVVFVQDFEADWDYWTNMVVDTISSIVYYNREGSASITGVDIYNGSWDWDIYGVRTDTLLLLKNGVVPSGYPNEADMFWQDSYSTISIDGDYQTTNAFKQYGSDAGSHVFRYVSGNAQGTTQYSYSNGSVPSYSRNLFVRGLPIEENASYRFTAYVKANQLGSVSPLFYADVMRGYTNSEKPFSMADKRSSFSYSKNDFNGDWEKITFMTYYTNDSIAEGYFYYNGYYWGENNWTWREENGAEHNYIQQPDKFFVRLSFASDSTDFMIDNISLTKSTIGGVEYYKDKIRVDFGYQTNLGELVQAAYDKTHIGAVELPGSYFEVWGLKKGGNPLANDWEEVPIRSAEYHSDGYMYMFTESYILNGQEMSFFLDECYDKVLVTFHNPVDDESICLRYTGNLYPKSDDYDWVAAGKPVLDFYNEEGSLNPYVFNGVFSLNQLPPVLQAAEYEDGSFGLDAYTKELRFWFSREIAYDNEGINSQYVVAKVGDEVWIPSWDNQKGCLVITRPGSYTTLLDGNKVISISNIKAVDTDYGENVTLRYHFGYFDPNPESMVVYQSDWRSEITEEGDWDRPVPPSIWTWNNNDGFYQGTGMNFSPYKKNGLYKMVDDGVNGDVMFLLSSYKKGAYGKLYTVVNLTAGSYTLKFPAFGWARNSLTTEVYVYNKPSEMDYDLLTSVENKTLVGVVQPTSQVSWSGNSAEHTWDGDARGYAQMYEFTFDVESDGNYVFEWSVDNNGSQNYYGVALGNFTVEAIGDVDLSYAYVTKLNQAVATAQEYIDQFDVTNYGGPDYDNLVALVSDASVYVGTSPSQYNALVEEIEYSVKTLMARIGAVDELHRVCSEAQWRLNDYDWCSGAVYYYQYLSSLYADVISNDFSAYTYYEILDYIDRLSYSINELDIQLVDINNFRNILDLVEETYGNAYSKTNSVEYSALGDAYNNYKTFDYLAADYYELVDATNALASAYSDYTGIFFKVERLEALAGLANNIGVDFGNDGAMLRSYLENATYDDPLLVDVYKAAIKKRIYELISSGDSISLDLTPFIANYNLFSVAQSGNQLAYYYYQWGEPHDRWRLNNHSSFDSEVFPGWYLYSGAGNNHVGPEVRDWSVPEASAPFDASLSLDWSSSIELSQAIEGLPVGRYQIGFSLSTDKNNVSLTVGSADSSGSYTETVNSFGQTNSYVYSDEIESNGYMSLYLYISSASTWTYVDDFQLIFAGRDYGFDYSYAADVANREYLLALSQLDTLYIPQPYDSLQKAKNYYNEAYNYAYNTLTEASANDNYRGTDYNTLAYQLRQSTDDFQYANEYTFAADMLYTLSYEMWRRIGVVDEFMYSIDYTSAVLKDYANYSDLQEYLTLDTLYWIASMTDCPAMVDSTLLSIHDELFVASDDLIDAVEVAVNGNFNMYSDDEITCNAGSEFVIPIKMKNNNGITAFSVDVYLPSGLTLEDVQLAPERSNGHDLSYNITTNWWNNVTIVSLACMSLNNDYLKGNDGTVVYLKVYADESMSGSYAFEMYDIEMTESPTLKHNPDGWYGYINVEEYAIPGDVNMDGEITITDAVGVVAFIINANVDGLNSGAADANKDGYINATDAVWIVNRVIRKDYAPTRTSSVREITSSISMDKVITEPAGGFSIPVNLNGMQDEITAIEFSITVPEGTQLTGITTDRNHMVSYRQQSDGSYKVICLSMRSSTFQGAGNAAMTLQLSENSLYNGGEIILSDAILVTPECIEVHQGPVSIMMGNDATGINGIGFESDSNAYDLQGRTLEGTDGIYIKDGKKMIRINK